VSDSLRRRKQKSSKKESIRKQDRTAKKAGESPSNVNAHLGLFLFYVAIIVFCMLSTVGILNPWTWATQANVQVSTTSNFSSNSGNYSPSTHSVQYDLQWQNQPGIPFTIQNLATYQYIDIELNLTGSQNFTAESSVRMSAIGAMSASLNNSNLAYISLAYPSAVAYPSANGFSQSPYGLELTVVSNETDTGYHGYDFGSIVKLVANPVNVTWQFIGGPYYPTLDLHYWNGHDINQTFTSAPVQIVSKATSSGNIIIIFPNQIPIKQTHDTPDEIGVTWGIGIAIIIAAETLYIRRPKFLQGSNQ